MRFNFPWQGAKILIALCCLTLAACGGSKGDSKKVAQIVDADKQGIVSIALDENDGYVHIRGTKQFVLQGTNKANATVDLSSKASWRLSNPGLGKIDGKGLFTPSGTPGELTLTASYAELSVSQTVLVSDADLVSISIIPKAALVDVCKNAEFTAEALFNNGLVLDYPLEWRLADTASESLARFPDKTEGVLSTRKSGSVSLVAEGKNNAGNTITSSPLSYPIDDSLASLTLSAQGADNLQVREGQTADVIATATWTDNSTAAITANASLSVSNTNAASIDTTSGKFTAKTGSYAGTPVTVSGSCDQTAAELVLTLIKPNVRSIEIRTSGGNTTSVTLARGNSTTLLVTATFEDNTGTDANYTHSLAWQILADESDDFDGDKLRIDNNGLLVADGDLQIAERINLVIEARVVDSENNTLENAAGEEIRDRINATINP